MNIDLDAVMGFLVGIAIGLIVGASGAIYQEHQKFAETECGGYNKITGTFEIYKETK